VSTEAFIDRAFKPETLRTIGQANDIIAEYAAQGFKLTLRQLYYQFVSRDIIANKMTEYKRLGSIINDGRLAGLIDWAAIEDRTRNVERPSFWRDPSELIAACADQYAENLWAGQANRVEVWIEKDALTGVIEPVCERWQVPYFACRGYTSQSEQYDAGKRLHYYTLQGITPIILHLGDHDPSGIDMTRDNTDRLSMFARREIEVRRLALNWEQVEEFNPPPNPAKDTDSRAADYVKRFGHSSWELDALDPRTIDGIIDREISSLIDTSLWDAAKAEEQRNKDVLGGISDRWDDVVDFIQNEGE